MKKLKSKYLIKSQKKMVEYLKHYPEWKRKQDLRKKIKKVYNV